MENKRTVKIEVLTGKLNKRIRIQNKVFSFSNGKEKKLVATETSLEKKCNRLIECYDFLQGKRYRIKSIMLKNGRKFHGETTLRVDKQGEVTIEGWEGNFCPKWREQTPKEN